ncbi:hypothetical protein H4S08_004161 [Coemansia sp. RSA 1365]|nr:hypothetical protein H4S08_004161 [Coemansia sp. RSA 1365]
MLSGAANSSRQQSRRVGEGVHPLARHVAYPDASAPTSVPVADTVGSNSANPPQFLPYSSPAYKYSEQERLQAEYEAARRRLQSINHVMYRHDDVILTLQLLAYLGKMSTQRQLLHECPLLFTQMRHTGGLASQRTTSPLENGSSTAATYTGGNGYASPEDLVYAARAARCSVIANEVAGIPPARRRPGTDGALVDVFSLVERFTLQNTFQPDMVYWSSVAMRNNCRRDESRGSCRQCAYLECQKWERHSNEFAKCRRCRKAKYCSKQCQSKAWQDGHRYWCIERTPSASSNSAVMEGSTSISADIIAPHALSATAVSMQHQPQQQEQQDHYSHTGYQPPPAPHAAGMSSHTAETGVAVGGSNNGMTTTRLATHESYVGDHIAGGSASAIQTAPASLSVPTVPVSLPLDPAGYSQPAGGPMTSNSHSGQHHHPYRQPSASDAHGHALSHPRTRPRHREAGPQ